jgi:predicted alpha-1,2-mannosidase
VDNARENLETEAGDRSFEEILSSAQHSWEDRLSLIRISGITDAQKEIFYTALYRAFQMPTVFNDVNGDYLGFDQQVHQATGFQYFTDLSLWDTYRTLHPLYNIIAPVDQRDMMVSLARMAKEGGWLPRWPSGNGYTGSMLGTPADITIADAWLKGIRDFDIEFAYRSMRRTALGPAPEDADFSGRRGIVPCLEYGYCPADMMDEAVSKTLEYAWADHAIAQQAESLGEKDDAKLFKEHAEYFVTELNDFFAMSDPAMGRWNPGPYYWHSNEPDIHAAYLFNEAGRPDLTQK